MNRKAGFVIAFILFFLPPFFSNATTYLDQQEFMSLDTAEKKYGSGSFDALKFRTAKLNERAAMAVSLIRSKKYIGKLPNDVKKDLGPYSGYFWSDSIPTYLVETSTDKAKGSWQLVFLIDEQGAITEVKIHKNCCATSK
mgnify:CR=1 FL=1